MSTPLEGPAVEPETRRDADGRLFNGVTPENFQFLLAKVGFTCSTAGTERTPWAAPPALGDAVLALEGRGSRSLEKIESILNRDKKVATYKPALFRALAELATTSYHSASWLPGGRVAVPIGLIADKWLEYFWPLFASERFIPQIRGEKRGCSNPVMFRSLMDHLISLSGPAACPVFGCVPRQRAPGRGSAVAIDASEGGVTPSRTARVLRRRRGFAHLRLRPVDGRAVGRRSLAGAVDHGQLDRRRHRSALGGADCGDFAGGEGQPRD